MDVLPMCSIFQELQIVHDTGYFSALPSLEEYWQQVNMSVCPREIVRTCFCVRLCAFTLSCLRSKSQVKLVQQSGTERVSCLFCSHTEDPPTPLSSLLSRILSYLLLHDYIRVTVIERPECILSPDTQWHDYQRAL